MTVHARLMTTTQKVETRFGSIYTHVSVDASGAVREVAISTPGKHADTAVEAAMTALGRAITECLPGNEPGQQREETQQ